MSKTTVAITIQIDPWEYDLFASLGAKHGRTALEEIERAHRFYMGLAELEAKGHKFCAFPKDTRDGFVTYDRGTEFGIVQDKKLTDR